MNVRYVVAIAALVAAGCTQSPGQQGQPGEQGPTGPSGPPGPAMSGDALVDLVNTSSKTLDVSRLPVGTTATTVAAGAHSHPSWSSYAIPWANGITYDDDTNSLFYVQYVPWTVGRVELATGRDSLIWWDAGANMGEGVATVHRLSGAHELWFSSSNWAAIRSKSMSALAVDPSTAGGSADYSFPCGGFSGLAQADAFSGQPDTFVSVRSDTPNLRYWVFGAGACQILQLAAPGGGETTDLNVAATNRVADGRQGGIIPQGLYHDAATRSLWVADRNNGIIWFFTYDRAVPSTGAPNQPLLTYKARIRAPTWDTRGLAYDRARKLLWTCNYSQAECRGMSFDIDAFAAAYF